jgi:hypothetical protein
MYTKGGQEYLLMSNTSRGVMKTPDRAARDRHAAITRIRRHAGRLRDDCVSLQGVEQLDLLDNGRIDRDRGRTRAA